jgi:hypothetical protein
MINGSADISGHTDVMANTKSCSCIVTGTVDISRGGLLLLLLLLDGEEDFVCIFQQNKRN